MRCATGFAAAVAITLFATGQLLARPGGGRGAPGPAARGGGPGGGARPHAGGPHNLSAGPSLRGGGATLNALPGGGNLTGKLGVGKLNAGNLKPLSNRDRLQQFLGENAGSIGDRRNGQGWEQFQAHADQVRSNLQNRADDLFTPAWYLDHPYAWQATHPYADAWAVATAGAVAAWLGASAATTSDSSGGTASTTEAATESSPQPTDAAASSLAAQASGDWLPLGVFALVHGNSEPNTILQLAINKQGAIGGTYYDLVADSGQSAQGTLDSKTQRAAWTVGSNKSAVFAASVEALTSDTGTVTLHFPSGKSQQWNLVRVSSASPKRP